MDKIQNIQGALIGLFTLIALNGPAIAIESEATEPVISKAELIKTGRKLASEKCAACHSIEIEGESINKDAPPFRTFASKWPLETLEESLAEGIVTGHEDMPEFVLTPDQIVSFLEFLGSLKEQ